MLASGKFPRFALFAAFLAAFALLCNLEFVHSVSRRLLLSNSLGFVVVFLAAACCFCVALRSSAFARQVWLLLAVAFSLETLGQGLATYYQSFVPSSHFNPVPSDLLFFVWAAPVFMIFLPRSDEESPGIDSLRLLDFLQVAIVAVTIYVYFFYFTSRWKTGQLRILSGILILYVARDLILSVGFFFRSRTALPAWFRRFTFVLSLAFLAAVLSDLAYLFTLNPSVSAASWGDLIWTFPSLLVVFLAVTWKHPVPAPLPAPPSRVDNFFAAQFLPVAMPLLVIFMAYAIAREQVFLAWMALAASVLCSSIRLILTNRRQRRVADNLLAAEKALRRSEQTLSTAFRSSPDSFTINVFRDGAYLEANEGFTRLTGYSREETLGKTPSEMNLWPYPEERLKVVDPLLQFGEVRDVEFHFRTKSGAIRVGLMSAALLDLDGCRCSLVEVRDITSRKEAEDILRDSEQRFRSLVENVHVGVVTYDPHARILFANEVVLDLLGSSLDQIVGRTIPELGLVPVREEGTPLPDQARPVPTAIATGKPVRNQLVGWRIPNRPDIVWTLLDAVPEFTSTGELSRVMVSFTNITEMKNAERAIHSLSTHLLQIQDEERRRIGRELHDGLAQTVLAINLSLAQARQSLGPRDAAPALAIENARSLTQQMAREIRTLSYLLHPPLLDDLGLVSALKEYAQGFSERSGIDTQVVVSSQFDRLPQAEETALFRIVQESLANIQRHSGTSLAKIFLSQQDDSAILEVVDFGSGMTPPVDGSPQSGEPRLGVGIRGMRERMALLGGQLEILTGPTGTTIRATIPLFRAPVGAASGPPAEAPAQAGGGPAT